MSLRSVSPYFTCFCHCRCQQPAADPVDGLLWRPPDCFDLDLTCLVYRRVVEIVVDFHPTCPRVHIVAVSLRVCCTTQVISQRDYFVLYNFVLIPTIPPSFVAIITVETRLLWRHCPHFPVHPTHFSGSFLFYLPQEKPLSGQIADETNPWSPTDRSGTPVGLGRRKAKLLFAQTKYSQCHGSQGGSYCWRSRKGSRGEASPKGHLMLALALKACLLVPAASCRVTG